MKAIICSKYGSPELLQIKDVKKPSPKVNEVLIKIHATAVNDYDWASVRGTPLIYRLLFGLFKPRRKIPGMELSGTIEELGEKAQLFKIGDAVYGDISEYGFGSFAEYICINEKAVVLKPYQMTFEEAASIPHAAGLAMQGLIDKGKIKENQKILINGAGGGVGSFGLQLAKLYAAEVTGVDTGAKLEDMKAIGFDHIIDYKQKDFTKNGHQYDLILDTKTNRSAFAYLSSLKPDGKYITVGGNLPRLLQIIFLKSLIRLSTNKKIDLVALHPNKDLDKFYELFEAKKIKCVIDGPYQFEQVPWAIQYFGEGKHTGKVIISMPDFTS